MKPKLRFPLTQVEELAQRYAPDEIDLAALKPAVASRGCLTKADLRAVARWKARRAAGYIERNDDEYVQEISGLALAAKMEEAGFDVVFRKRFSKLGSLCWALSGHLLRRRKLRPGQMLWFDRILPIAKTLEHVLPVPGMSLIMVGRKPVRVVDPGKADDVVQCHEAGRRDTEQLPGESGIPRCPQKQPGVLQPFFIPLSRIEREGVEHVNDRLGPMRDQKVP